jgi:hypothetical protein
LIKNHSPSVDVLSLAEPPRLLFTAPQTDPRKDLVFRIWNAKAFVTST